MIRKLFALLALVGLTVAPSTTWAAATTTWVTTLAVAVDGDGGNVAVSSNGTITTTSSIAISSATHTYTITATPTAPNIFVGWFKAGEDTPFSTDVKTTYAVTVTSKDKKTGSFPNYTYTKSGGTVYAKFDSHKHLWDVPEVAGANLTVNCTNESTDCSIEGREITLTLAAENYDYTGNAPTVSLDGKDDFDQYLKERITYGTITYVKPAYSQGNDQWYTGDYTAVVTVTVDGVAYELTKAFSITKPEGGYTSGFEVNDISFKTTQEALDFAPAGGTVVCHSDIKGITLDFKTDNDVTLNLNGKTLTGDNDMTIKNTGSGTVTLTGGTFQQPRKTLSAQQVTIATGKFVFTDLTLSNAATDNDKFFTVTVKDEASLSIESGKYLAGFSGANVTITGGKFWNGEYINLSGTHYQFSAPVVGEGYAVIPCEETMKDALTVPRTLVWEVVEHQHSIVYGAVDNVITAVCNAVNHEYCKFGAPKLTLTATNEAESGSAYTGAKVETDEGFPVAAKDVTIVYYAQGDQATPLPGAPTASGEYVAKVTVEGVTAEKAFQITHVHTFVFGATDNVLTAACTAAGFCDSRLLTTTLVAENVMYDGEPHGAWLDPQPGDGFPNVQIVISYTTAEGEIAVNGIPVEIGEYIATATIDEAVAPGVKATVRYRIEPGAIVVDGKHYALEDVPNFVEKKIIDGFTKDMYISVGKNFAAKRAYTVPGPALAIDFDNLKTKYFDLNGFSITGAVNAAFFENEGKLVLSDSSEGQTGRLVANPENTMDVPLIINRAGKATKVFEADVIESYGAELTIESGIYLGMISNEVGEVAEELLSDPVDLSGKIVIKGGKFLYRPEDDWLDKGCYIVEETLDDGTPVYAVYPHVHDYKFIPLGSFAVAYCTARDEGQGLLERSSCRSKVVLMTALMQNRMYDGKPVDCPEARLDAKLLEALYKLIGGKIDEIDVSGVYYINLSAIFRSGFDASEIIDILEGKTAAATIQEKIDEFNSKIREWIDQLLNPGDQEIVVDEDEAHLTRPEFELLTGAEVTGPYYTTNASLIEDIIGDGDERLEGAPTDAGRYKVCFDILTPSGNDITVRNAFEIGAAKMDDVKVEYAPNKTSFVYRGEEIGYSSVTLTYKPANSGETLTLVEGKDYDLSGETKAVEVGDYSFTLTGKGNYDGERTITWQIVEPTGEFGAGALKPTESPRGEYATVRGNTMIVSRPQGLEYDEDTGKWLVGFTIDWPAEKGSRVRPADARVVLSPQGTSYHVSDIIDGNVGDELLTAATDGGGFIQSVTWKIALDADEVIADYHAGLSEYVFTLTANAWEGEENATGIKPTAFNLVVPLGNLSLIDDYGFRVYPVHLHKWVLENPAEGQVKAWCDSTDHTAQWPSYCRVGVVLTLGEVDVDEYEYTGDPIEIEADNVDEFRHETGAFVSRVHYEQNGVELASAPTEIGSYTARVEILPMGAEPYICTKTFSIVPQRNFEIASSGERFVTYAEAVAALTHHGDKIRCHQDILAASLDLTTPYDVILDLDGHIVSADGNMVVVNNTNGVVTIENGTIRQPGLGGRLALTSGAFVFGWGLELKNADASRICGFDVSIAAGASLEIDDGRYNAKFSGRKLVITGGLFSKAFYPGEYVPKGYKVILRGGDFAFEVISEEKIADRLQDAMDVVLSGIKDEGVRAKVAVLFGDLNALALKVKDWIESHQLTEVQLAKSRLLQAALDLNVGILDGVKVIIDDLRMTAGNGLQFKLSVPRDGASEQINAPEEVLAKYLFASTDGGLTFQNVAPEDLSVDPETGIIKYLSTSGAPGVLLRFMADK